MSDKEPSTYGVWSIVKDTFRPAWKPERVFVIGLAVSLPILIIYYLVRTQVDYPDWVLAIGGALLVILGVSLYGWLFSRIIYNVIIKRRKRMRGEDEDDTEKRSPDPGVVNEQHLKEGDDLYSSAEKFRLGYFSRVDNLWNSPRGESMDFTPTSVAEADWNKLSRIKTVVDSHRSQLTPDMVEEYRELATQCLVNWRDAVEQSDNIGLSQCSDQESDLLEKIEAASTVAFDESNPDDLRIAKAEESISLTYALPKATESNVITSETKGRHLYRMTKIVADLKGESIDSVSTSVSVPVDTVTPDRNKD